MMRFVRHFLILSISAALLALAAANPALAQSAKKAKPSMDEPQAGAVHVYLLRGLINIFSTGMDDLAEKLHRRGIRASVYNHTQFYSLVQSIAGRHRAGRAERVIIVGHSLGANDAVRMAASLGEHKIHVPLVITYDPTVTVAAPANVSRLVNFYQSNNGWGARVVPGRGFRGSLNNIDMRGDSSLGHASIDKSSKLHVQSIGYIQSVGGGRSAAASRPAASSDEGAAPATTQAPASSASTRPPL
jgi:hypothetical protein